MSPDTRLYLAIDQGGHASRASLYQTDGRLVSTASIAVDTRYPAADRVEHDPKQMVASVQTAVAEVVSKAGSRTIAAAGLATQRSTVVCWDRSSGIALSPVISWQDRRVADWLRGLHTHGQEIRQRTGLPLSPHYGAGKLRWCWDNLPVVRKAWEQGRLAWGPLASYLIFHLTAQNTFCADPANASRTQLWNLDDGDWDPELTRLFGIPDGALPPCVPSRYDFGEITIEDRRMPLTLVTGDQSAALFAAEDSTDGRVMINLGTGAFLQRGVPQRPPPSALLTSLAYRDETQRVYALEGTINGAGSALTWVAGELGLESDEITRHLPEWLRDTDHPPLFLNGIAGLGTPYLMPSFAPRFVGNGSSAEKSVAVIESIVFLLQINLEEMSRVSESISSIIISGGLARLDGLCQRLADLSGIPLARPADFEATMRGLLRLLTATTKPAHEQAMEAKFVPQVRPSLSKRYHKWREALETAIAREK